MLNFTRQRVFPDEDVPLSALEFLAVNVAGVPAVDAGAAVGRGPGASSGRGRMPRPGSGCYSPCGRRSCSGFFTLSPFKLPHYGLPAFPALALLAARAWDDSIEATPGAAAPRTLMVPICILFARPRRRLRARRRSVGCRCMMPRS